MITVFLSHSSQDKPFVRELADFLERHDDILVWLDEREIAPGDNIVGSIGDGLNADFILLILSPDSVNSNWVKEEWTDAFWEQTNKRKTKLVPILYRDCDMPRFVGNKQHIDLRTNQPNGFRKIRAFLLTHQPARPRRVNQLPDRPPIFVGREAQLKDLRSRLSQQGSLVPICEMPGRGKTALANEFAHRYQHDFEAVYWLSCQSQSLAAIASELMRQLDLKLDYDLPGIVAELKRTCSQKRCLLILDNVDAESPGQLISGGASSVLVTTRHSTLKFLKLRKKADLPLLTEDQCFEIFRQVLGDVEVARHVAECKLLFKRLDCLPIGIIVSAGLIKDDVHYTIASLSQNPPDDVHALIREAIQALDPQPRRLLAAMAACSPEGFRLDLAAMIGNFEERTSLDALQHLVSRNLVEEVSRNDRRYRLHSMVRHAAEGQTFSSAHAAAIRARFRDWEENWRQCAEEMHDFQLAFGWYLEGTNGPRDISTAAALAYCGFAIAYRIGRLAEAFEICERMSLASLGRDRRWALRAWLGNQALILKAWGRLEEALTLHKKEEVICEELGNRDGLQRTYGNQAVILKAWGRLQEAFALHQKEEEICEELGNKDGLQATYGNQALILKAWGRLEEALALHLKEEEICEELGDRDGLQRTYGNQAVILQTWGRLEEALVLHEKKQTICEVLGNQDGLQASYGNQALILQDRGRLQEALALHKKEEAICKELGNRDGLQRTYGNQALILKAWGRLVEALALHQKEEEICEELGNKDGLQASYGNQALILKAWGRLEEALALHQKQEAICLELGNKQSLGICYWAWGLLDREMNNSIAGNQKLTKALAIFQELNMPRERDAVQAELSKGQSASRTA